MNKKILINFKSKNILLEELLKQENIEKLEKKSVFQKINFIKNKKVVDLYFHSGELLPNNLKDIENSRKTIVNSKAIKKELIEKFKINDDKIEVIYPSIMPSNKKAKATRIKICKKYEIDEKRKIIFFTAKNLKKSGVKEFIQIVLSLTYRNVQMIIATERKQIENLKFQLSRPDIIDKILFIEDKEEKENLFLASDIFLLPSSSNNFSLNILKAMYFKCAVFLPDSNPSSEIIDTFATMNGVNDASVVFKIDALLNNKKDLKLIKKENKKNAQKYLLSKNLKKVNKLIKSL